MKQSFFVLILMILMSSCGDDEVAQPKGDLLDISYAPTAYALPQPDGFPVMKIPEDNPLTEEGIELGRRLFYDVRLSKDNSKSCASCHLQELGFTDGAAQSTGVDGGKTDRSSMSLVNIGYSDFGMFWDGRASTLEDQALLPVEDPIELIHSWDAVEGMLRTDEQYPAMFRTAFGIDDRSKITRNLAAKAMAQFQRSMISYNSKYDKIILQRDFDYEWTESELRGYLMFIDDGGEQGLPDAECNHCHTLPLATTGEFFNNGLDSYPNLADYVDKGFGGVTGNTFDNGKFKATTLRNIELTAPYMHDGRFATLEETVDHYNNGVHFADNLDANLTGEPLGLTESQKVDLINFLRTLTDTTFLNNPAFQNPF